MKTSDIDSIVHLLKTISPWGVLFILLILLPIYIGAWIAIIKLFGASSINKGKVLASIFASFTIALILLKIGVDKDEAVKLRAARIKNYLITYGYRANTFSDLSKNCDSTLTNKDYEEMIARFPEDFTITYYGDPQKPDKGIILTNPELLDKAKKVNEANIPFVHEILKNYMPIDSVAFFGDLFNKIDSRLTDDAIEMMIQKYPGEFTEVNQDAPNRLFLKRLK